MYISNEFDPLKKVIVSYGESIPHFKDYRNNCPDFLKFHSLKKPWDESLLLRQQRIFFEVLEKYEVELFFAKIVKGLPWQMYTRDMGFVYKNKFFYSKCTTLKERENEFESIAEIVSGLDSKEVVKIEKGKIEGGDVLTDDEELYIGISNRTTIEAAKNVEKHFPVKTLCLGEDVMHLDTRMAILPGRKLLIYPGAFQEHDLRFLQKRFEFLPVTESETRRLGTNVFIINPRTIVVAKSHTRIIRVLRDNGFQIEELDYSEPIILGGSFRCSTLPVERSSGVRSECGVMENG